MKYLRFALLALLTMGLMACASSRKPKSGAHMYEGDSSPNLRMYEEGPGSPLHN